MTHENLQPSEIRAERGQLSLQIEKELNENEEILVAGVTTNIYKPNINDIRRIAWSRSPFIPDSIVNILCSPKEPNYNPLTLDLLLVRMTKTPPTDIQDFDLINKRRTIKVWPNTELKYDLKLGKLQFDEPKDEAKISGQRTIVHLFPNKNYASNMYGYMISPSDWNERRDWYDHESFYYSNWMDNISASDLYALQHNIDIFYKREDD